MPVNDTFAKRRNKLLKNSGEKPGKLVDLPQSFRVQVVHIWKDAVGPWVLNTDPLAESLIFRTQPPEEPSNQFWQALTRIMTRELGVFYLGEQHQNEWTQCQQFLFTADTEDALSIIEMSFSMMQSLYLRERHPRSQYATQSVTTAVQELNERFEENGLPYRYLNGKIIETDSQYLYTEVTEPAIRLLQVAGFRGPEDEFLRAEEHFRKGRYKEAIVEALKAFESTMKAICDAKGWPREPNWTASALINAMFANHLLPEYLQSYFASIRGMMEGVATARNKSSGHGQGAEIVEVPKHLAAFVLHMAASNIVFLVEAYNEL